ncbi:hypothetical protein ACFX2C_023048 [Malus domestica]
MVRNTHRTIAVQTETRLWPGVNLMGLKPSACLYLDLWPATFSQTEPSLRLGSIQPRPATFIQSSPVGWVFCHDPCTSRSLHGWAWSLRPASPCS